MRDLDYTASVAFLRKIFAFADGDVELRVIGNNGGAGRPLFANSAADVINFCKNNDKPGQAVYFGCSTRKQGSKRGRKEDLLELVAAWLDVDCYKLGRSVADVTAELLACPCPPSLIVSSGGGVHAYWLLREALPAEADGETLEAVLRGLALVFAGDPVPAQMAAVMRLPGTHNSKGETWRECVVLEESDRLYELADLAEMLDGLPVQLASPRSDPITPAGGEANEFLTYAERLSMNVEAELAAMRLEPPAALAKHGVHITRLRAAGSLVARGHDDEAIFVRLMAETERAFVEAGKKWDAARIRIEEKRLRDEIRGAHERGYAPKMAPEVELPPGVVRMTPRQQEQPDDDPLPAAASAKRPVIFIKAGELSATADLAEQVLIELAVPFYARSGKLMRPVVREATAADDHKTKVARLDAVTVTFMVDTLSQLIEWRKYDKRAKAWVRCDPPAALAATLLDRAGTWAFPEILAVITAPTMRPDGSLFLEEGYDPATQLLLLAPPPMPVMPARPSKSDAEAALAVLDGLLDEFCFVDEPSRAVAMSALITPVVRGCMLVCPAHVIRAPAAGTGKTYLIEVSSAISVGRSCQALAAPKNDEEFEKRIGAVLIGGQATVSFDNLNGELRGDSLCHMIERPLIQIRPLGFSQLIDIEARICVFATGNNITIAGDLLRRSLLASLDADMERPEEKQFRKKPFNAVLNDRGKYIAAALTVVRAYQVAGFPGVLPALASFGDWSRFVRSALVWLGMADPVETIKTSRDNDPEIAALHDVVTAWNEDDGLNQQRTAGELIGREKMKDALLAVATGAKGELDAGKLGRWLTGQKDKTVGEFKIISSGKGGSHGKKWKLMTAPVMNEGGTS